MHWVITQINRFRLRLRFHAAPAFAPEPLLGQRIDRHLLLNKVREILIKIRQRVWIRRQLVVHTSQNIAHTAFSEQLHNTHAIDHNLQIHFIQRADMIGLSLQVLLPESLRPELDSNFPSISLP